MAFDYATCSRTYVMLRIYHDDMDLAVVQKTLGLRPTRAQKKGDRYKVMHVPRIATVGFWLLSSEGKSQSTDSRKHLQWLLKKLDGKAGAIAVLKQAGYRLDICCFWEKASGGFGGGPTLSPEIMRQLADLDLEFWFDIYSQWSDEPPDEEVH